MMVSTWHQKLLRSRRIGAAAGALMLGLYVLVYVAGAASHLHHLIHEDAHEESHHCVVTIVASGEVFQAAPETFIARDFLLVQSSANFTEQVVVAPDYLLSPGRAPPIPA